MLKLVILWSAVACALGAVIPEGMPPQLDGRIVGGAEANIASFPWQVSIQRSGAHFCGGSIYSNTIIVTAAHCMRSVSSPNDLKVRAGSRDWQSGGNLVTVAAFKIHGLFNPTTMINDVALIRLSAPLVFSNKIKKIGLTTDVPANGSLATVTGWGATSFDANSIPKILRYVNVDIVRRGVCASNIYNYGSAIRPTMVCAAAEGKDACVGDSGGPLVSDGVLVGIVSWGVGCAEPKYPGVYSSIAALKGWITDMASVV